MHRVGRRRGSARSRLPPDAVIHLAGESIADGRWTAERVARIRESLRRTDRARIARAIAQRRGRTEPRVFVSASAVGFYGMRKDDEILDEASPAGAERPRRYLQRSLGGRGGTRERGTPACASLHRLLGPAALFVLGRDGGALPRMALPFRFFVGGPVGDGRQWVSWIHIRDEVRALVFALDTDAMSRAPSNSDRRRSPSRCGDMARAIGHAMHRPAPLSVPRLAARASALGDSLAQTVLTGQRAIPAPKLVAGGLLLQEFTAAAASVRRPPLTDRQT